MDVSDMVQHMLDAFTNTQQHLINKLQVDFKRLMTKTTSKITSDFLQHMDHLTECTDDLGHILVSHQQKQATIDDQANKLTAKLQAIPTELANQLKSLQRTISSVNHQLADIRDRDDLKQYLVHDSERALAARQDHNLSQLCQTIVGDGQLHPPPTPTRPHAVQPTVTQTQRPTLPPEPTHATPCPETDPGYALVGRLTDLLDKMATKPVGTRRDAPKISAPTLNGAQNSSFETRWSSLEDKFTYLQWPLEDTQRLPTVLQGYAKVHYNSRRRTKPLMKQL
jgi:exonuclease VII large subunit